MPVQEDATRARDVSPRDRLWWRDRRGRRRMGAASTDRRGVEGAGRARPQSRARARVHRGGVLRRGAQARGTAGALRDYAEIVLEHEKAHVAFLKQALGAAAEPAPRFDFGGKTEDAEAFAAAALTLEDLAVATYNGQAVNLTPASLKAAARIVSVEGRHAAWIRSIVGDVPATDATDPAVKEDESRQS